MSALLRAGVLGTLALGSAWAGFADERLLALDPSDAASYDRAKRSLAPVVQGGLDVPELPARPPEPDALSCGAPCLSGVLSASTPFYDVYLACDSGAFTARTGAIHSVTLAAFGPQNVIFGGASGSPGTSDVAFHFHDQGQTYLNPPGGSACVFDPPDTVMEPGSVGIEQEWRVTPVAGITATLREEIVAFGTVEANSGVRLTLAITNDPSSASSINVGMRWQIDYQNGGDDGPLFTPVTCDPVTFGREMAGEHDFLPAEIQDFYRIRNNTGTPIFANVTSTTPISGIPDTNTPSRLVYGTWPSMRGSAWNYLATEGANTDFDSAVLWYAGYLPADGDVLMPGETARHSVVIFTSPDLIDCGSFVPGCAASITSPPANRTICLGDSTTLDASGITLTDCAGTTLHDWTDGAGFSASGAVITVSPTTTTDYTVAVSCAADPACNASYTVRVTVEQRPDFSTVSVTDVNACNLGLRLEWAPATFHGPTGTGVYTIYRSMVSCADALAQPPVATGLVGTSWGDRWTQPGGLYYYVVLAEDDTPAVACLPGGPFMNGTATSACAAPATDVFAPPFPDGIYAALRARHAGDSVTMDWSLARPLLAGEHFHVLKAWNDASGIFAQVNAEGDTSLLLTETDLTAPLQFFNVRVANACEDVSFPEYP